MLILKINHLDANVAYSMVQVYYGLAAGLIQPNHSPMFRTFKSYSTPLLYLFFVFTVVIYVNNRIPSRKVIRGKSRISTAMDRRGLLLLTFLWTSATTKVIDGDYQLAPLSPNPGLYFEQIRPLRVFHTQWRLVTGIEVAEVLAARPQTQPQINRMKTLCATYNWTSCPADGLNAALQRKLLDGKRYEELLLSILGKPQVTRAKRSVPLGFIGSLSKALFGTLDSDDAQYYNKEIDKLYKDQNHLAELLGNQTHIIKSEFQDIHNSIKSVSGAIGSMDNRIKEIAAATRQLDERETKVELESAFSSWTFLMTRHVDEYVTALIVITDALTFAKLGILHPAVLSPSQLAQTCERIRETTPYEFPLTTEELNSEQLQGVTKLNVVYSQGRIILSLDIPLLDQIPFDLFYLHPCPSFQTISPNVSTPIFIKPRTPYLAISQISTQYFMPDESYISGCRKHPRMYMCELSLPLQDLEKAPSCETDAILKLPKIRWNSCNIQAFPGSRTFLKKMIAPNTWLYSVKDTLALQVRCNKHSAGYEVLQGAGVLQLRRYCEAKIGTDQIWASGIDTQVLTTVYKPSIGINISEILPTITEHHVKILIDHQEKEPLGTLQDAHASANTIALEDIERQAREIATHHRTENLYTYATYGLPGLGGILIILLIVWISYRCLKARRTQHRTPLGREAKVNIEMVPQRPPPQIISRPRPLTITPFPPDLPVIPSTRTSEKAHMERASSFGVTDPYFEIF